MFKAKQHTKSIFSGFLAGMYLLLVLLAPSLHQHHSDNIFKLSDVSKTEKQISKVSDSVTGNDCLACHFLTANHSITSQEFEFSFQFFSSEKTNVVAVSESIIFQKKYTFQLRGPPAFQV